MRRCVTPAPRSRSRMLGAVRTHFSCLGLGLPDQSNSIFINPRSSSPFSLQFSALRLPTSRHGHFHCNLKVVSCHGRFHSASNQAHDDFLEASLLLSETLRHYHLRKHGFHDETKQPSGACPPFSAQVKDFRAGINTIGLSILARFQNPTIFLKISCEGDFLLPVVVGEFAIENLIDSSEDIHGECSNHFLFVKNLVFDLGYEVKMIKLTKRVVNAYFARIYFGKTGEKASFSVDAHPSDAIDVARRCKAPIYVEKQIVLTDAVMISYGTGRIRDTKPIYDVLLDSPMEGPDLLGEELRLVQKMRSAVKEERYKEAVRCRDKLVKLQHSGL